jgi:transcriptional regulator
MYVPQMFEENRVEILHDLIRKNPFGTLVTLNEDGWSADHVPFLVEPAPEPYGVLHAHVARANPVWRNLSSKPDVLAIFQGPQAYVSPSWYVTKQETGMVVPTWNYAIVHAHGTLEAIDDPAWLRAFLHKLTNTHEAANAKPWSIADAPQHYIETQLRAIVGVKLTIKRLVGKWKMSQNRPAQDRLSVIQKFSAQGRDSSSAMAETMQKVHDEIG